MRAGQGEQEGRPSLNGRKDVVMGCLGLHLETVMKNSVPTHLTLGLKASPPVCADGATLECTPGTEQEALLLHRGQ